MIKGIDPRDNTTAYAVIAYAQDGEFSYKMTLRLNNMGNNKYALATTSCACKSTKCGDSGCNISEFGSCACTDCNAENR